MTTRQKLIYAVGTEIDVYTNMVQEEMITDKNIVKFVIDVVIPRFNKLRAILAGYENEEEMFKKKED